MLALSKNKEDYLKALFHLTTVDEDGKAGINQLANYLGVSAASVNNMLKKLKLAELVTYEKYGKVELTLTGRSHAIQLVRKHRIWETFLHEKLGFAWDEVHDVAEQLEHVKSDKLIDQLDLFLGHPTTDPHGDIIPGADGSFEPLPKKQLSEVSPGTACKLIAVNDSSSDLLQYASKLGLSLNKSFKVLEKQEFDNSMLLSIGGKEVWVSDKFAQSVFVVY
ncbi:MAG: metal-dependent transcriptional regulator [Bacteroidetes bacterium]|nr:metal-dependent transcriptional regulator [Bacteroidota bacterium]